MRAATLLILLGLTSFPAFAQSEKVVEIESRGQKVRAILIVPPNPKGSVILLAGGHGKLDISPQGTIGELAKNQLVRTRAAYSKAGYAVLVPDIAPDLKTPAGVVPRYRDSEKFAKDLAAEVVYMRKIKAPVVTIGTSRGTLSVANFLGRIRETSARPDAAVLTSGFLGTGGEFQVRTLAGNPAAFNLPVLVVHHRKDACSHTSPSNVEPFKAWYEKNGRKLDIIWMDGGLPPKSNACNALSAHGFYGLDDQVVARVTGWIGARNLPAQ
jgi:dienelactone hydrolase